MFVKYLQKLTPKYLRINNCFDQNPFILLDIGAGNHSCSKYKNAFPNCEYHGVDLDKNYNNDENDFSLMKAFYEMDLTKLDFSSIPDNHFDFIMMAHIIEHLHNGDQVIKGLIPKLKSGGYIYIEYPGLKSTKLPSMSGSLNFYDDSTHVRVYSLSEIREVLGNKFEILSYGSRRNLAFLIAMPFKIMFNAIQLKKPTGNMFWDLLGFAELVFARKK
jgi:SAM-dependent methyltransferase